MSPRRRRLLLAICFVLTAILIAVVLRVVSRPDQGPVSQDRPGPVLLVSGYGGGTASLERLAVALRAQGRIAQVVPPVGDGTGDLRAQARSLATAADRSIAAGAPSVDVIGYSAGGVVTRIWLTELGGSRVARRVVTLGSPHHGSQVAAVGAVFAPASCPLACQQLVPDSPLLGSLRPVPGAVRWVSIWTANDQTVTPPDSARLDGAVNVELQSICPAARVGHGQLPTDPLVRGIVALALGPTGLTAAPEPAQCARLQAPAG